MSPETFIATCCWFYLFKVDPIIAWGMLAVVTIINVI